MTPDVEADTQAAGSRPDPVGTDVVDRSSVPGPIAPATPELASTAGRRERLRKIGAIVFIGTVLLGAGAVTLTRSPYFDARTIRVRGTSHVARADVLRIASITHETNVFTLDASAAEARLERDPWIAEASITKHLPSGVVIDVHERAAVATADDQHLARRAVRHDRHVDHHLVIDELVALAGLHDAVQDQHPAERPVLEHQHLLQAGMPAQKDTLDLDPLPPVRVVLLLEPVHHRTPRSCSESAIRPAPKACRSTGTTSCGRVAPHMNTSIAA